MGGAWYGLVVADQSIVVPSHEVWGVVWLVVADQTGISAFSAAEPLFWWSNPPPLFPPPPGRAGLSVRLRTSSLFVFGLPEQTIVLSLVGPWLNGSSSVIVVRLCRALGIGSQ